MNRKRIIIIGGLSAGPSAAAKARRTDENAEIILFEKTAHISYATCGIPYALSGKIESRDKLMIVEPELMKRRFEIDVHLSEPVLSIDTDNHRVLTDKGSYEYDKLVFAAGGFAMVPPIEHLDKYNNWAHAKTIEDFDRITKNGVLDQANHITVVGAGLIGLETAENLIHSGKKVTVIEFADQVLSNWDAKFARIAEKVLAENGIDLRLSTSVKAVDPKTKELILSNGERLYTDFMLVGISVKPNTEMLIKQGAAHLHNGAILVNEKMETTIPDVYAAGDCASIRDHLIGEPGWFPMGTHSNKGGRTAGANAAGGDENFYGAYGTAIMKLFNYTIARTGLGPKSLDKAGIKYQSSLSIAGSTPSFFPGQKEIITELYFDPKSGKIYGAELLGEVGVDKRIDVLSTAIFAGLTIYDLPNLDLAYAPPYAPAKDPVIVAGYVAQNGLKKLFTEVTVKEANDFFESASSSEFVLIDVRTASERLQEGAISGSVNIPLDDLRGRLDEVPNDKKIFVHCAKGLRGYLATLILAHHGYKSIHQISGGFKAWKLMQSRVAELSMTR